MVTGRVGVLHFATSIAMRRDRSGDRLYPYDSSIEQVDPDEEETIATLVDLMRSINETTFKSYGHAVRSSHAKSYGLLKGQVRVLDRLPPE
jgi:hypothetical protein